MCLSMGRAMCVCLLACLLVWVRLTQRYFWTNYDYEMLGSAAHVTNTVTFIEICNRHTCIFKGQLVWLRSHYLGLKKQIWIKNLNSLMVHQLRLGFFSFVFLNYIKVIILDASFGNYRQQYVWHLSQTKIHGITHTGLIPFMWFTSEGRNFGFKLGAMCVCVRW